MSAILLTSLQQRSRAESDANRKEKKMRDTINVTQEYTGKPHNHSSVEQPYNRFRGLMQMLLPAILICLAAPAAVALAQEPPKAPSASNTDNPISASNKLAYSYLKYMLLRSAEKMPEEFYNFKPAWVVRDFGKMIGHVADSQYFFAPPLSARRIPRLESKRPKPRKQIWSPRSKSRSPTAIRLTIK